MRNDYLSSENVKSVEIVFQFYKEIFSVPVCVV